jgi:hypothetical protein
MDGESLLLFKSRESIVMAFDSVSPGLGEGKLNRQGRQARQEIQMHDSLCLRNADSHGVLGALGGSNELSRGESLRLAERGAMIRRRFCTM